MNNTDFSIFNNFSFEYKPIGIKFHLTQPKDIEYLDKKLSFCEMLKEAQISDKPFYIKNENHECKAGSIVLGMSEADPVFESGQIGPRLGVFEDTRANEKLYIDLPKIHTKSINYVSYTPLEHLKEVPDLLIITAPPSQAEILLRSYNYRTGASWNAKGTTVVGCAYLYAYPYISGELNILISGLHHGMKARNLFPEGLLFLSIPYNLIPEITENLKTIDWELPQYSWGKKAHIENMSRIINEVNIELQNSN